MKVYIRFNSSDLLAEIDTHYLPNMPRIGEQLDIHNCRWTVNQICYDLNNLENFKDRYVTIWVK